MSVRKDPSGRRWVQVEVEVPGTPEEVWQAIATGPGVSSWFVPTEIDGREGGAIACHFGPGMDSAATITAWEPPHRLAADSPDMGPGAPTIATEWLVEARAGGTCVVRVVHSLFAENDDWDSQLESTEGGWDAVFRILRLYLTHFPGQPCAGFQLMHPASGSAPEAWKALTGGLGIGGAAVGQRVRTSPGAPALGGLVERAHSSEHLDELLLRLDEPAPGVAHLAAIAMGGRTFLPVRLYLYGDGAAAVAAREEPVWRAWAAERFPPGS